MNSEELNIGVNSKFHVELKPRIVAQSIFLTDTI